MYWFQLLKLYKKKKGKKTHKSPNNHEIYGKSLLSLSQIYISFLIFFLFL